MSTLNRYFLIFLLCTSGIGFAQVNQSPHESKQALIVEMMPIDRSIKGGTTIKLKNRKYGSIAINAISRQTYGAWNYDNEQEAEKIALNGCGSEDCISYSFNLNYGVMALAPDNSVWGADTSNDLNKAMEAALANCNKYSHLECEIAIIGYLNKAPIKYEWSAIATDGRNVGNAWYSIRKSEAEQLALQYCGSQKCWAYAFQSQFAAIAMSSNGKMYGMHSELSLKDAEFKSIELCKSSTKRACRMIISGSNKKE